MGKTWSVRQAARLCGAEVFHVDGPDILGSVAGESEEKLRDVFEEAAACASPSLVFIDEIVCPVCSLPPYLFTSLHPFHLCLSISVYQPISLFLSLSLSIYL